MFCSKIHRREGNVVLAVCDKKVLNKTFETGSISFFVDPSFYGSEEIKEEKLLGLFEEANIINLAGGTVIDLAIKHGYVDPENVVLIGGCGHAQVVKT